MSADLGELVLKIETNSIRSCTATSMYTSNLHRKINRECKILLA